MSSQLQLLVLDGPDRGHRFVLPQGHYRALGRGLAPLRSTVTHMPAVERELIAGDLQQRPDAFAAVDHALCLRRPASEYVRDSDIELCDAGMSHTHALIFGEVDCVFVVDVNSRNGSYFNGVRRSDGAVWPGDILRVGETRLRLIETQLIPRRGPRRE